MLKANTMLHGDFEIIKWFCQIDILNFAAHGDTHNCKLWLLRNEGIIMRDDIIIINLKSGTLRYYLQSYLFQHPLRLVGSNE